MNTRRSFFKRISGVVAAVAIAPELAFRVKLALPVLWKQDQCFSRCVDDEYQCFVQKPTHETTLHSQPWEFETVERGNYYVMENYGLSSNT